MVKRQRFFVRCVWLAVVLASLLLAITAHVAASEAAMQETVQVAQAAVARAQTAVGQAEVVVARIEHETRRIKLAEAQQALRDAEAQAHVAMDALQRAMMASSLEAAEVAAIAAQTAAVTAQTRANIAVAHLQVELMFKALDRIYGQRFQTEERDRWFLMEPVRWVGQDTNTFTRSELRAAMQRAIVAINHAMQRAADTEQRVQRLNAQAQRALSGPSEGGGEGGVETAFLAAEAAQADALALASAAQLHVADVMAQVTKHNQVLGVVDQLHSAMQSHLNAIENAEPILPATPLAEAEGIARRAVARSALARAHTALAQAEVAWGQAHVFKLDLHGYEAIVKSVKQWEQAAEAAAQRVAASADASAQTSVAATQAAAAAAIAWSQVAISAIQADIARAVGDDSAPLKQLISETDDRLQDARRWAVKAGQAASQILSYAAVAAVGPSSQARQAVVEAQAQAQVAVANAQESMLKAQWAMAQSRRARATAAVAQHAAMQAQWASNEAQKNFTLSNIARHAIRTVSAIVTVAAAVMPTRPHTWYEDAPGPHRRLSLFDEDKKPRSFGGPTPGPPSDLDPSFPFDDLRPPTADCGVSCAQ